MFNDNSCFDLRDQEVDRYYSKSQALQKRKSVSFFHDNAIIYLNDG